MAHQNPVVERFLDDLDHPLIDEVRRVRAIILGASSEITEQIKWNAPSFCVQGDDRITLRLYPPKAVQLIFHRGAKVKDSSAFTFDDPTGLVEWRAPDRGSVTFRDMADVNANEQALIDLVNRWVDATSA